MADAPESLARGIGTYIEEVAAWCDAKKLPSVNALAINASPLVAEYFRCFLAQLKDDRTPVQLTLPIMGAIAAQSQIETKRVLRRSA